MMPEITNEAIARQSKTLTRVRLIWIVSISILIAITISFFWVPSHSRGRPAGKRMACSSNIKLLAIALRNYEFQYKETPPAYTVDGAGKPLHSWRALILPFMEQDTLYKSIDFSKPWDHPANENARNTVVPQFSCPATKLKPGFTTYLTVVSPNSCLQPNVGMKLDKILDQHSDTLVAYECNVENSVHWMNPSDSQISDFLTNFSRPESSHFGGRHVVTLDCSVRFYPTNTPKEILEAMITIDGSEPVYELPGS